MRYVYVLVAGGAGSFRKGHDNEWSDRSYTAPLTPSPWWWPMFTESSEVADVPALWAWKESRSETLWRSVRVPPPHRKVRLTSALRPANNA